jgi:TetR/AcrR family fatty acid metabolism transcriptional regulator
VPTANQEARNEKRRRILDAATREFSSRGFYRTRISDIAKAANVADGTVYLYFDGKEELLGAIFDDSMKRFIATGRKDLEGIEAAPDRLRHILDLHLRSLGADRELTTVFQIELRHSIRFMDLYSRGRLRDYFTLIEGVLKDGQKDGSVRADLDTWFATKCIFGILDEAATNWVLSEKNYRLHAILEPIMDFVMAGVKTSDS